VSLAERRCELPHDRGSTALVVVEEPAAIGSELLDWVEGRSLHVVTSRPILEMHGEEALGGLSRAARDWQVHEVPDGEAAKTPEVAGRLWHDLLAGGARRDSRVLTFGGGSVCDLGAFVAGTFMRGLALCHVPTTLLAQVDAAVGGKSALNLAAAKNVVGVFHHPERVVASTRLLATLPRRELAAGLVEAIKMAALLDLDLLAALERDLDDLLGGAGGPAWADIVAAAQRTKAGVVTRDPREAGERRVLNFGHTLGHALEVDLDFGVLPHGEAVAHGMRFALQLAEARGLDRGFAQRLEALLARLGIPPLPRPDTRNLLRVLQHDKKAGPEGVIWVLPTAPGRWEAARLPGDQVAAELEVFVARHCGAC
jgi:3-dehydroquinate synthase